MCVHTGIYIDGTSFLLDIFIVCVRMSAQQTQHLAFNVFAKKNNVHTCKNSSEMSSVTC